MRLLAFCAVYGLAFAQTPTVKKACTIEATLLGGPDGLAKFSSAQMKSRATAKSDIGGFLGQADVKGHVILEVTVGTRGDVLCVRALRQTHPLIDQEVERAVKLWRFAPARQNGKSFAYLGLLEFALCNINCGPAGASMTLLR